LKIRTANSLEKGEASLREGLLLDLLNYGADERYRAIRQRKLASKL